MVAQAEGDAARFRSVQTEYAKAPQVTRDRIYLETMQQIYANTNKILIDAKGGNNLLYLPLDKLHVAGAGHAATPAPAPGTSTPPAPEAGMPTSGRAKACATVTATRAKGGPS